MVHICIQHPKTQDYGHSITVTYYSYNYIIYYNNY